MRILKIVAAAVLVIDLMIQLTYIFNSFQTELPFEMSPEFLELLFYMFLPIVALILLNMNQLLFLGLYALLKLTAGLRFIYVFANDLFPFGLFVTYAGWLILWEIIAGGTVLALWIMALLQWYNRRPNAD